MTPRKSTKKSTTTSGGVLAAVDAAVASMSWLKASDAATVALARSYAERIDAAAAAGGEETAKALFLGPHLLNTLRSLGGTPGDRKALHVDEEVRGKLAELRAVRSA